MACRRKQNLPSVTNQRFVPDILPEHIATQLPSEADREAVKRACLSELFREQNTWNAGAVLKVVDDFVEFCTLLSKPENQIKVPSGQYIEREVTTRSSVDMKAEMAQELADLPRYTAWAKILDPTNEVL